MIRLVLSIALIALVYSMATYDPLLHKVQKGESILVCNGNIVNPERIIDFIDDSWIFDNGYAKNCEVK